MLTSFFKKSTPLNYLLLSTVIAIAYLTKMFFLNQEESSDLNILGHLSLIVLMVFVMLLLDFIIRKNSVTGNNTFAIFIFVLFVIMVPSVYNTISVLLSNVFLLLATRRILSLTTEKNTEKKIFDATMYITIASLLYFWAFMFLIVLFVAIIHKTHRSPRLFLIPFAAITAIGLIFVTYHILQYDSLLWFSTWVKAKDVDYSSYNNLPLLVPAILIIGLLFWTGSVRFFQVPSLSKNEKPAAASVVLMGIVLLLITVLGSHANGSELIFIMMPASITTANFVELKATKERAIFNEILLWFIFILALIIHFI